MKSLIACGIVLLVAARCSPAQTVGPTRPNVIFILIDDLRFDALGCTGHPFIKTPNIDRIRTEGVWFKNAFVTTSLCSPSRASFLTGMYAHTHGVTINEVGGHDPDFSKTPSFAQLLQKSGYETALIGKWHMEPKSDPRPGFDYWLSFKGQGVYNDPELNENGRKFKANGYITEILNDAAIKFLETKRDKPFCLYLSHKAVHDPRTVRPADQDLYAGETWPKPESFDDDLSSKPRWQRANVVAGNNIRAKLADIKDVPDAIPPGKFDPKNKNRLDYCRLMTAVDEGVGKVFALQEKQGQLDNTIIVFAGDNGYFFGEHRVGDKRLAYEESMRIPMLMRYPPLAKKNATVESMVLNIDLAPTLLDLCGAPSSGAKAMQGRSVRPLLQGKTDGWRTSFLYEYWVDLKPVIPDMVAVRTDNWKLVTYPHIKDIPELYDLKNDPHEMKNLSQDPAHAQKQTELKTELDRLKNETGDSAGGAKMTHVYIASHSAGKDGGAILHYRMNPSSGKMTRDEPAAEKVSTNFLVVHPSGKFLYGVGENSVIAFAVAPDSGKLTLLNQQPSGGKGPCHLALDPAAKHVLVANYGGGTISVFPIEADGRIGEASANVQHSGTGSNPKRQEGPHPHWIGFDPTGRLVLVPDLGLDKVVAYDFAGESGTLKPHDPPFAALAPGAGPRHLDFHPSGRWMYVANELNSTATAFNYDPARGAFAELQSISTLPPDFSGTNYPAEIEVHPNGRFLYASNRGHDSIALFSIDSATHQLTLVNCEPTRGQWPRHFAIDPTGQFLFAANEHSNDLAVFRIDASTGRLSLVSNQRDIPSPFCVAFIPE